VEILIMTELRKGIVIFRCDMGENHGYATLEEISPKGPLKIHVRVEGFEGSGKHGFHIHRSGNTECGAKSLCDHYNPTHQLHGDLNEVSAHVGDLGNITSNSKGIIDQTLVAERVRLSGSRSVYGRSMIIHENEDDLGDGGYKDSLTTGHSGRRVLWGIIAINDEPCS
jgi:Cu-Zn family superoxide dismutase